MHGLSPETAENISESCIHGCLTDWDIQRVTYPLSTDLTALENVICGAVVPCSAIQGMNDMVAIFMTINEIVAD